MCAVCRMAVSQKQFAAEILDSDENEFKFDDVRCMLRFLAGKGRERPVAAMFVMDHEARRWLKAEQAYFVRSARLATPMGGGYAAFGDSAAAAAFAKPVDGTVLTFSEMRK
ncbi:MAG: nitrous oxide reductase accessory protein NosL [Bryobacteraceae bacterium]